MSDLWVVNIWRDTDVPIIDHYHAVKKCKNGWKVMKYGHEVLLRDSSERNFFSDKASLKAFMQEFLNKRLCIHDAAIKEINHVLSNGFRYHPVDPNPLLEHQDHIVV